MMAAAVLAAACSFTSSAAPPEVATVGFLRAVAGTETGQSAMVDELRRAGFTPGRNLELLGADPSEAYADPEAAADTLERWRDGGLDVLVALSTSGASVAREVAPELPVVFVVNDPVAVGLVSSEDAPEGQLTGVTYQVPADRTLDIARRAIPDLTRIGFLYPVDDPAAPPHQEALAGAARSLGLAMDAEPFASADDVGRAVGVLADAGANAIVIANAPRSFGALEQINEAASERALPTIANTSVADGALVILAPDSEELFRQVGRQAVRILRGAAPSEIPVEDPRQFDVLLDADVAARLGIELPEDLVREADEVRGGGPS